MGKNIRSSSSPKALATSFPMPPLADAMDAVRLSVDRFCLLAGVEALAEMMEEDATTVCGARHRRHGNRRGYRWGHTQSEIGTTAAASAAATFATCSCPHDLLLEALNLMVLNVSTRKYHRAVRLPEGDLARTSRQEDEGARLGPLGARPAGHPTVCSDHVRDRRRWQRPSMSWPRSRGRRTRSSSRPCSTISSPGGSIRRCPGCSSSMARRRSAKRSATPSVWPPPSSAQVHKGRNTRAPAPAFLERQEGVRPGTRRRQVGDSARAAS